MDGEVITFTQRQILELVVIIFDKDKDSAFKFLESNVYKELERRKQAKCKPQV